MKIQELINRLSSLPETVKNNFDVITYYGSEEPIERLILDVKVDALIITSNDHSPHIAKDMRLI